jgi:hypothetical protein
MQIRGLRFTEIYRFRQFLLAEMPVVIAFLARVEGFKSRQRARVSGLPESPHSQITVMETMGFRSDVVDQGSHIIARMRM